MRKFICFSLFLFLTALLFPAFAQTTDCSPGTQPRAEGLVTTPDLSGKFGTSGKCIVSDATTFVPFKIQGYNDLKSIYFDQYRGPSSDKVTIDGDTGEGGLSSQLSSGKKLLYITGNLGMNGNISGTNTAVVFVNGYLYFASPLAQFTYGNSHSGIVFVVNGDVFIDTSVTQIDAVIISSGVICTASAGTTCPSGNTTALTPSSKLLVNGSLISLESTKPIRFRRTLTDNSSAAEVINHQPKYLVILRNLMSQTLQKWSEIP